MRLSEEVQSKMTILKVKEWETFQVVLRSLRRFARKVKAKKVKDGQVTGKIILVAFIAAMILSFPGYTSANETGAAAVAVMDEVVVTATKTEEKRKDIVNSVVIKDAVDIEEAPAESVGALLANEPGIDWRTRGNYGGASEEIHIRGMGADATQVVVDGVVINSPSLGSADVSMISLNSIEKIEVVKGPGSLLYGSGAMGGTINIITKKPKRDQPVTKVEAGYGTESTYHLAAETGRFATENFGYYLTVNRRETDGFRDNSDLEHNDIGLNLLFDKGEMFGLDFNFGFVDRKYGTPGVQPPVATADYTINGVSFYNNESQSLLDRGEDENRHSSLEAKGKASELLRWRIKGDCAVLQSNNYRRGYNTLTYSYDGGGAQTIITNTIRGVEGNLDLHPATQLGILLGTEYRNFEFENEMRNLDANGVQVSTGAVDETHNVFTNGTFVEASLKPVEMVKLVAGYRYEKHSLFGHENIGRYGLVVSPMADTVLKVNHGKHFKAPTLNDLFWPDDGFARGNSSLKQESGWNSDFTIEQSLQDGKVFASLSYFKWDIADKISWVYDSGTFYYSPFNLDTYRANGWEINTRIGPYYSMVVDLGLTLLDAEEQLSSGVQRQARYTPEKQFKIQVNHFADFGLNSALTVRYTSDRPGYYQSASDTSPQEVLDSFWTVDVKLAQALSEGWRVTLLATNLFDEEYNTYLAGFDDRTTPAFDPVQRPYPGAGRSIFASVAYEF